MNFADRISNQTTIYYSQGRYNRDYLSPDRVSSSSRGDSPAKQKKGKESTKNWVVRSFYSKSADYKSSTIAATNPKPPAVTNPKPPAATNPKPPAAISVNGNSGKDDSQDQKEKNLYDGKPAVFFQQSVIDSHAEKFKFCLVGKFPKWRPSLSQIREWATAKWRLRGQWSITLLDHRHVLVTLDNEDDMVRVWGRNRWFVGGHLMKVFKWFPTFVPSKEEPSSAAIWVSLPFLPVVFFQEELLYPIAALAGKVLGIDGPTRNLSRTNVARVCVEVDLLKDIPRQVWVGVGEGGFWQDLCYERLPPYCADCRQQGHSTKACQASRSHSRCKTAKQKPSIEDPNSHTRTERRSQEYFSKTKRVRISPIIEDEHESDRARRQDSNQSKGKGTEVVESSASEASLPLSPDERSSGEQRAERSNAGTSEPAVVLADDPNLTDSEGDLVPRDQNAALHVEVRWKRFGLAQGESFHRLEQKSPPRKKKPGSKRPIFFWKTKQKEIPVVELRPLRPPTVMNFKYSEIKKMTKTFRNKIGEGGFGTVYRGTLPDGREVAVKLGKDRARDEEFINEVGIIREINHTNVIRLLGFCSEGARRALVYEFMPSGSLDKIIYSNESGSSHPERSKQLCKIAVGVARGLEYLQHGCDPAIVHFDVKPSNILLDRNLCPKLSDFGLARRWGYSDMIGSIRGTMGYIAPELFTLGRFSTRTDVYSYGIMLLEMALRRKPVNFDYRNDSGSQEKYLVDWVIKRVNPFSQGGIRGYVWEATERKMILVGLWCTQSNPANRPSFGTIVDMLEGSVEDLSTPPLDQAAFVKWPFSMENASDHTSVEEDAANVEDAVNVDDDANVSCSTSSLVGR